MSNSKPNQKNSYILTGIDFHSGRIINMNYFFFLTISIFFFIHFCLNHLKSFLYVQPNSKKKNTQSQVEERRRKRKKNGQIVNIINIFTFQYIFIIINIMEFFILVCRTREPHVFFFFSSLNSK